MEFVCYSRTLPHKGVQVEYYKNITSSQIYEIIVKNNILAIITEENTKMKNNK